jgi:outer membrane lipoprotein-sorting protein
MKREDRKTGRFRFRRLVVLVLAGLLALALAGCNAAEKPIPEEPGNELKELLSRSAGVEGLSYRVVTQYPMWSHEARVWMQGDLVKTETVVDGETLILVVDKARGELLSYDAAAGTATRMSLGEGCAGTPESPLDYIQNLDPAEWVPGEAAFFEGLRCRRFVREEPGGKTVLYLWEEYGLPLRVETTVDGRTTVTEFRELEVGLLPEDTFDLPAGVQVMDFWEGEPPE